MTALSMAEQLVVSKVARWVQGKLKMPPKFYIQECKHSRQRNLATRID